MILILHDIRSVYNVGSILRTADGAGIEKVYLTGITPSPLDRVGEVRTDIKKTALGAEESVAWQKVADIASVLEDLKAGGYQILAVEQDKRAVSYKDFQPQERVALIFGNEVEGLSRAVLDKTDTIIEIPMHGAKESLNVAVSVGIVIFHYV